MSNQPSFSIDSRRILITGPTGYIGGRLLDELEKENRPLRCLVRKRAYLRRPALPATEIVVGDVLNKKDLIPALQGIDTAFYLVHSMGSEGDFRELDKKASHNFGEAAAECGVKRIIYLGGLGVSRQSLSDHLESRQEVGQILRNSAKGVQVVEFRASVVIGSGSLSFEMVRALCERLPFMVTPKWVRTPLQPIAIKDLLAYLKKAADTPLEGNPIFEIGGKDRVTYSDLMQEYCRQRGLKRYMLPVPVLTPRLSSLWLGLVTPLYARIGRKLIDSAIYPTIVEDPSAAKLFGVEPAGYSDAIAEALRNEDREFAQTRWIDSFAENMENPEWGGTRFGNRLIDIRTASVPLPPEKAFLPIRRLGGKNGYYYGNWLWQLRGALDLMAGGVGMRRGRRDPENLEVGDILDFWRVEVYEPGRRLLLRAEMKVPGRAWLEFKVDGSLDSSLIKQIAIFDPLGLWGLLYWYAMYPLHCIVFAGMIKGIAIAALNDSKEEK